MVARELRTPNAETCTLYVGVSAGPLHDAACVPVPLPLLNTVCFGVAVEQSFDVLVHAFYGRVPEPGWTFTKDGLD